MKHLFLTGERGVGKSTALRRTVEALDVTPGGFRTCFDLGRTGLYLSPAWEAARLDAAHAVARMEEGRPVPDPAAFDRLGAGAIRDSAPWARLLLFDECGNLEREGAEFRRAVLAALDGAVPILGVVKPDRAGSWLTEIAEHPRVELIVVTEENRNDLPRRLVRRMRETL